MKRIFTFAFVFLFILISADSASTDSEPEKIENYLKLAKTLMDREKKLPQASFVYAADGSLVGCFASEKRTRLSQDKIPVMLERAIIASEDKNFYSHYGIDPAAVGRAAWNDILAGKIVQGGSSLTQQTAKNYFLTNERSFDRKKKEALLALSIERTHTKREILTAYVNVVFLGRAHGFEAAAKAYFGRPAKDLSLSETAFIVGLINNPNLLAVKDGKDKVKAAKDMEKRFQEALKRKYRVLRLMRNENMISYADFARAYWEKINILPEGEDCKKQAPYLLEDIRKEYKDKLPLLSGGLRLDSTSDPFIQKITDEALKNGLNSYRIRRPENAEKVQGAAVVLDKDTAEIRAMAGGEDFNKSEFNNATQALRQPGSALKPFTNAAYQKYVCKTSREHCIILDRPFPISMGAGRGIHYVENYPYSGGMPRYRGPVTQDIQIMESRNAATIWMAAATRRAWIKLLIPQKMAEHEEKKEERIAYYRNLKYSAAGAFREYEREHARIARGVLWDPEDEMRWLSDLAKDVGISSKLEPYLVTAIGASEVKLLELVAAYIPFFNGGFRIAPTMVRAIYDSNGKPLAEKKEKHPEPAFVKGDDEESVMENARIAQNMKELLQGVVDGSTGTAHVLRKSFPEGEIGCKTGTATNAKDQPTDNWIICATPRYVIGVWIGLSDKEDLGNRQTGATNALPIAREIMEKATMVNPHETFEPLFPILLSVENSSAEPIPSEESNNNEAEEETKVRLEAEKSKTPQE
ncbi:hypothetical protein A3C73_03525 [Candidatus Giovannonibacteria bacterium RIFCSPHIGHO2_02_FULL_44_11]|nr:MAG: hypothetical protein A3C73_03525 [Candidatus Giovannonibacteria bacterium RIFCSPHIGHO2_02_FULL_44_11]